MPACLPSCSCHRHSHRGCLPALLTSTHGLLSCSGGSCRSQLGFTHEQMTLRPAGPLIVSNPCCSECHLPCHMPEADQHSTGQHGWSTRDSQAS